MDYNIQGYFEYIFKNHGQKTVNLLIKRYINKIEKKTTFKINKGYYLELSTPETKKLIGSTKNKRIKDKNSESTAYLEITEVVLIYLMLLIIVINKTQESCIHLFLKNLSVIC